MLSSAVAAIAHARQGHVKLRQGLGFGAAGLVTATLAAAGSKSLSPAIVLAGFAVVMLLAAGVMWRGTGVSDGSPARPPRPWWAPALAGAGVGALIGVFGVGGGFLAVPALIWFARFSMADAIGTSLLIIVINSLAALATRLVGSEIEWNIVIPFALAASLGALGGGRLATRFSGRVLQRSFAVMLVALATFILGDQLI